MTEASSIIPDSQWSFLLIESSCGEKLHTPNTLLYSEALKDPKDMHTYLQQTEKSIGVFQA